MDTLLLVARSFVESISFPGLIHLTHPYAYGVPRRAHAEEPLFKPVPPRLYHDGALVVDNYVEEQDKKSPHEGCPLCARLTSDGDRGGP